RSGGLSGKCADAPLFAAASLRRRFGSFEPTRAKLAVALCPSQRVTLAPERCWLARRQSQRLCPSRPLGVQASAYLTPIASQGVRWLVAPGRLGRQRAGP